MGGSGKNTGSSVGNITLAKGNLLLDEHLVEQVLGAAQKKGGEFADLYAERRFTTSLSLEDGNLEKSSSGLDAGAFCPGDHVDPSELEGLDDWAEWLDSLRTGFCEVREISGRLQLVELRQLVAKINRGIRVEVYPKEHQPPHFHVKSATLDASFTIDDCKLLDGWVPNSDLRVIRYWHMYAKPELIRIWDATRPGDCAVGVFGRA